MSSLGEAEAIASAVLAPSEFGDVPVMSIVLSRMLLESEVAASRAVSFETEAGDVVMLNSGLYNLSKVLVEEVNCRTSATREAP